MIPLRDTVRPNTTPVVTRALIVLNVLAFLFQLSLGPAAEAFVFAYGLVPRAVTVGGAGLDRFITSMFLHGGWAHLIGNLLYLHIFGDNVEDRLGHLRFVVLYFLTGIIAGLAQVLSDPGSLLPMVGASGAIAGVTGAYFIFFPHARVVTLVPVFVFLQIVEIPAVFFLFFWFAFQLMLGISALGSEPAGGGVAFWAHVGGFLGGMVLGPLLARRGSERVHPAW